jgi:hypothetical protein
MSKPIHLHSGEDHIARGHDGNKWFAGGTSVPANGAVGYATGCYFIQTDGGVGTAAYINEGSATSADFNSIQPGSAGGSFTSTVELSDDTILNFGTDADQSLLNRSTALNANTALTDVLVGTPVVQATPANSLIISNVTADGDIVLATNLGGNSLEAIRVDASASQIFLGHGVLDTVVADGSGLLVGGSSQLTVSSGDGATNLIPEVQVQGTARADSALLLACASTTDSLAPSLNFLKNGAATFGSNTIVAANEVLGEITWFGADGSDFEAPAAQLSAIALATPGAGDMPGAILVKCTTDAGETLAEVGRFSVAAGLTLGLAGTSLGKLSLSGNTSGVITINGAAAAGTYTLTLPPDDGDAGEQLQTNGSGVTTWEAAGSMRAFKNLLGYFNPQEALDAVASVPLHRFKYKRPEESSERLTTTGDFQTEYVGIVADEAPFLMHHNGRILNPINTVGYLTGAIQALLAKVESLEAQLAAG